jgi:hypothetical protein
MVIMIIMIVVVIVKDTRLCRKSNLQSSEPVTCGNSGAIEVTYLMFHKILLKQADRKSFMLAGHSEL